MKDTITNIFGIQECGRPDCKHKELTLQGAWAYEQRIFTDKFSFICPSGHKFVGSAEEAEIHQDGIEARNLIIKAEKLLEKTLRKIKYEIQN